MSEIKGNGIVPDTDIDTLENELSQLMAAEQQKRKLWEKLSREIEQCGCERAEIASRKLIVKKQVEKIWLKQTGGKYVNRG